MRSTIEHTFGISTFILRLGLAAIALVAMPARAAQFVYVTNSGSNTVAVIDRASRTVVATIPVGTNPLGVALTPDGAFGYVGNHGSGTVSVISTATNTVVATIPFGSAPGSIAITPDGAFAYVTNHGSGAVSVIATATNTVVATIPVGGPWPIGIAITPNGALVYVTCQGNNSNVVSVIATATHTVVANIGVGWSPWGVAITPDGAFAYVANGSSNNVSVIATATNTVVATIGVGANPVGVSLTPDGAFAYVANNLSNTVSVISTASNTVVATIPVAGPHGIGVTPDGAFAFATNAGSNTVSLIDTASNTVVGTITVGSGPLWVAFTPMVSQFLPVTPCRLVDTRTGSGGGGPIEGGTAQTFNLPQLSQTKGCMDLSTAVAYSLNLTAVPRGPLGYLTIWPAGQRQPVVSTLNAVDGRVKANAVIVPAGHLGGVSIFASNTTDVVLDIDGYFAPASSSTLAFYPLPPCRVVDTRNAPGGPGGPYLKGQKPRNFPVLESSCFPEGLNPAAYSFNFTAVPNGGQPLGYLTVWPMGQSQPIVSTLNSMTGTVVANGAIAPAGTSGDIEVFASNDSDLVVDVNGYFAAPGRGGLSLYPALPCRVLDTRNGNGAFIGELNVDVQHSGCAPPSRALAYVFNATVVPSVPLGYLTLWPDGAQQPVVSTLNAVDGAVTSNMAIAPTNNGQIDAYASNLTQLILDISSYFAP